MALTDLPYAQRAAEIERQRRYAELLQQQAAEPLQSQIVGNRVVPISPWLGLAKMLQAGIGGYYAGKAGKAEAELDTQQREKAKKSIQDFMAASGPQKGWKSEEAPAVETRPLEYTDFQNEAEYEAYRNSPDFGKPQMVKPTQWSDETGQYEPVYNWTETTKPGLSRNEQIAKLLEMQMGDNKYIASAVPTLSALTKSTEGEIGAVNPADWTPESLALFKQKNDYSVLVPKTETIKATNLQRTTKEWSDAGGNKWKQDYTFDPATGTMTAIGKEYRGDVYHAPGTSKDDDTKAGATLRAEYNNNPIIKRHQIISSSYENILNNQETGAGDMALIFGYMKMLDSDSAVREGEYATAENSGSIPQSVRNYYNRAVSGERLQPEQRAAFIKQAKELYQTSAQQAATVRQGIEQIGKDTGVNPRLYPLPEPKRRTSTATEPPEGFVVAPQASQSNFSSPSGSLMFQFPSGR